ncbi:phospholipase D family protein [Herminiimonas aquatilis]|uniref:phospholipase D n=1 Tax=Herminiimonas aquatilis TaxID=345342 RepID=A0ABW2J4M8_9BURK
MTKIFVVICLWFSTGAFADTSSLLGDFNSALQSKSGQIETAFSPDGDAEKLVIKVIDNSELRLRVAAYSFTSANIVRALIKAKRRGVDVEVLVDEKANKGKANQAALNLLVNSEIPTKTISRYAIHHDKYLISDGMNVQTGSFNYSAAAAKSNSENVIVIWNRNEVAASYEKHWNSRWSQGAPYKSIY